MINVESILVTGGSGYIGRHLLARLRGLGCHVRATRRTADVNTAGPDVEWFDVGDIGPHTAWNEVLRGIGVVVHLAGRAHSMRRGADDAIAEFRRVNVAGTEQLARAAADAGVRRLVYVSSVKVNGERTVTPFVETDPPHPEDAYGISKLEAEQVLLSVQAESDVEMVIVRPPLVFGADAPGNFGHLLKAVKKGVPLPFGAIENRRSLVNVHNLVDFLVLCCEHPLAAREIFLVCDGDDISTADLVRRLAEGMGSEARLFSVPTKFLRSAAGAIGRKPEVDRLCGSLQVSTAKARKLLQWHAAIGLEEGLVGAAREFAQARAGSA